MKKYSHITIETNKLIAETFVLRKPCTVQDVILALDKKWLHLEIYTFKKYDGKQSSDVILYSDDVIRFRLSNEVVNEK